MANPSDKKSLLMILSVLGLITISTYLISVYAHGYQINFQKGPAPALTATGLLSATSRPKSASVYIDDKLVTATDDTINLPPDTYKVKIVKDGYLPWEKTFQIKKETVFQTDTQLFRSVPDLIPITLTGALNPTLNTDSTQIIYSVASASAAKDNGLYTIELTISPLPLSRNIPKKISSNLSNVNWSKFNFSFSPNSKSFIANNPITNTSYLLSLDTPISSQELYDITPRMPIIKEEWTSQLAQINNNRLQLLPKELQGLVATDSAKSISYTNTDDKVLYLAKEDGSLPQNVINSPPAQSTQTQSRELKKDNYYVYDLKDDTNFLIGSKDSIYNPFWLPNSNSIVFVENKEIKVIEYDGTNKQTLFAGSFNSDVVYPWSDGSRIITLTSPYQGAPENLYAITIR